MKIKDILLVDDDRVAAAFIEDILVKEGYSVRHVRDGKEALDKAKQVEPDLILLDIRMPKMDGITVAKKIREFNKGAKIIFLTGFQSPELSKEAQKYDISGYIVKSSPTKNILKVIQEALK